MTDKTFIESDREQLAQREINPQEAQRQLDLLRRGKAFLSIDRPCTVNDGITRLTETAPIEFCRAFAEDRQRFTRFVPASGAASRMFQGLFPGEFDPDKVAQLRNNIEQFPFYSDLAALTGDKPDATDDETLFRLMLSDDGLGLASKPKGLLPLHRGEDYNRTAFAEHLHESSRLGITRFHFTVSPDHLELFEKELEKVKSNLEAGDDIEVSFSLQSPGTDTIALDQSTDGPFRNTDNDLLFRPAGHGALLQNLENCRGDLVLIRNIDNVVPKRLQEPYQFWTEILGGMLLKTQQQVFTWLRKLESNPDNQTLVLAGQFLQERFGRSVDSTLPPEELSGQLIGLLDRPIRVCGMVPVSGQPGGGPFWVRGDHEQQTPQIVEGVQIDPDDLEQQKILGESTHFNPVNIACSLRDRQGRPYKLDQFVDPQAAIITAKNHSGRDLLALERPGLWNGAMADWNTLFVEMPETTFNPVKTVFDLLQSTHQPDHK